MTLRQASVTISCLGALLVGCTRGDSSRDSAAGRDTGAAATTVDSSPPAATPSAERRAVLERTANEVVSFLAGEADFQKLALADTVELYLSPEGAGTSAATSVRLGRDALRDRNAWTISAKGRSFSFVPGSQLTRRTVREGTHFACNEIPLASRVPRLATRPHVGVRLEPREPQSCMETWNATFVFDTSATPRLVAALYDQWEW